jgi:hypothetical protein
MLVGIPATYDYISKDASTTYRLLTRGALPAFLLGHRWHARPDALDNYFEQLEQRNLAKGAALDAAAGNGDAGAGPEQPAASATPPKPPPSRRGRPKKRLLGQASEEAGDGR